MLIYNSDGALLLNVDVDNESVRYKAIKGENTLTLRYSLPEHVELPVGAYCSFKGEKYILMTPEDITLHHRRSFEYNVILHAEEALSKRFMFINPVDGRLKFPLTAKPVEHLRMFVDNMNMRDTGWGVGECVDQNEVEIAYSHITCHEALVQLAEQLELDFWFEGKTVNLGKLESNKETPLALSYGGDGEGLDAEIKRVNYSDAAPVDVLYVQGSESNIDYSTYGSKELHLPVDKVVKDDGTVVYTYKTIGYDGVHFENEEGFDASKARYYTTCNKGLAIRRSDIDVINDSESSLDCSNIEPTKEETVLSVVTANKDKHFYDIVFSSDVDYRDYQIKGENPSVIFQKGMLAGKEFDVATNSGGKIILYEENGNWRMELKPQDIDGITMPDPATGYMPVKDDTFKFFGIQLPNEYLCNNETKTGAEWDMFRKAVKYMYDNEVPQYTFTANVNELYAKRNWSGISDKIALGSHVSFSDRSIQSEPVVIRIVGIKEKVNSPYSPQLELSNATVGGSFLGTLTRIESQDVIREEKEKQAKLFTKRKWQEAKETISMLQGAFKTYSEGINPVTVNAMSLLVGDESLQFRFIARTGTSMESVNPTLEYYPSEKIMATSAIVRLVHMTLGLDDITARAARTVDSYRSWLMDIWESGPIEDATKAYYLYVKAPKEGTTATYILEEEPMDMDGKDGYYYFLVGILNSEYDGTREFAPLYGYTEVLPARITTDVIRSTDGSCYFDLANNEIGGVIKFKEGSEGLENAFSSVFIGGQNMLRNSGFTGDYLSERIADGAVLHATSQMSNSPLAYWEASEGVSVVSEEESASGYAATLSNVSVLTQSLYNSTIEGEKYIVSFKAKGVASLSVEVGGDSYNVSVDSEGFDRHHFSFVASRSSNEFTIYSDAEATLCELQLERGTVATTWSNSPFDNSSDRAYYQALKYLSDAIKGSTVIDGGLVLTNLLKLGLWVNEEQFIEKAGVSGLYEDDDTPAFWAGGSQEQAQALIMAYLDDPNAQLTEEQLARMAKFVLTHGGKAILNDGIFRGSIYANKGDFAKGCTIGGSVKVIDGGIEIDTKVSDVDGKVELSETHGFTSVSSMFNVAIGGEGCGNTAVNVGVKGAGQVCPAEPIPVMVWGEQDGEAIQVGAGTVGGLRTKSAHIANLENADTIRALNPSLSNILFPQTGAYDVSLDDLNDYALQRPMNGQELWLETLGADIKVTSSVKMWSHVNGAYETEHTFASRGVIRFKYYGPFEGEPTGIWTYTWVESR